MSTISYFTKESLKKLQDELEHLKTVERPNISNQIAEARDKGDLSENAEYDAAKEAQGLLEMKIAKLEDLIANARIIDESKLDNSKVLILSKVTLKNLTNNAKMVYILVPENEANMREGKISVNSPIAKALLGKKQGEKVEVQVPNGKVSLEIEKIER
jgi:transcription elongation factor GreA